MCTSVDTQVLLFLQLLFHWTTEAQAQVQTPFILPLKVSPVGLKGVLSHLPQVSASLAAPLGNESRGRLSDVASGGLALALDPERGLVNFLPMVDNLQGDAGKGYYLEMLIGTPPQKLQILVDTGSSNFAVAGVPHPYVTSYFDNEKSRTYHSKNLNINVKYTQGSWTGSVGEDVVTIPKGFNSTFLVNIAIIFESEDFFLPKTKWDGILGLAYAILAKPSSSLETFFDSLVKQAKIPNIFSIQMCGAGLPRDRTGTSGGSLVMGGIEPSLYEGDIWYTTIKKEWYYQIEILKLEIGGQNLNLDCSEYNVDKAIVDSGTTLFHLPQKVFEAVIEAVSHTSLLYILPILGTDSNYGCYRFGISSSTNSLIIGATIMEGFYVVFDRAQKRIGFALSLCAEVDGVPVSEISGPFSTDDIASSCIHVSPLTESILWIVSYALMSLCGIIFLVLITLLFPFCHLFSSRDPNLVNDESCLVQHRWK
ncbi:beta-secretase 2 isoform X2 [Gracilinanus agilis]|uniref:beta-secretase 2 isoform X2 n=1 Tax=Gracilinanus agilis TaxID=191870 RepID=UPI001CFC5E84|nr:beta-secretase 2 isoform X2 [Gracilinanus agilis]